MRANELWRRGLLAEAMVAYRQVIRDQPWFMPTYDNLAQLLYRQGQQAQAELLLALTDALRAADPRLRRLVTRAAPGSKALAAMVMALEATPLFDGYWYGQQHPELALLQVPPAEHWLRCGVGLGWNPSGQFDSGFYVECHELELQGINPLLHFLQEGQAQGWAATPAEAFGEGGGEALRRSTSHLWGPLPLRERAEAELRALLADRSTPPESRLVGGQQLAAALGWWGRWPEAEAVWRALPPGRARSLGLALLLQGQERLAEARAMLRAVGAHHADADAHLRLAWANGCDEQERLAVLNGLLGRGGLTGVGLRSAASGLTLDNLEATAPPCPRDWGLVSVIVPVRNAAATLETALASICNQSYRQLEVLVVDDASEDGTAAIAEAWAQRDGRVRLLRQRRRSGPYRARNRALAVCRGQTITCHDGDDWSHPQKLERQLRALQGRPQQLAVLSRWARCSEDLRFSSGWRVWPQLLHDNLSSLLLRREALERLGGWDPVLVGADGEYCRRITAVWGAGAVAVVDPAIPLSLGRLGAGTLTQASATHVSSTLHGLRHCYRELTRLWQQRPGGLERASQMGRWRLLPPECFGREGPLAGEVLEGDCGDRRWLEAVRARGGKPWLRHRPSWERAAAHPGEPLPWDPLCLELLEQGAVRLVV